ncbi:MAG: hypothetical protein V5A23_07630 [Halobacteriales archaeon]
MNRREFLGAGATLATVATAGCLDEFLGGPPRAPPTVADRPDAVYVPSHVEEMAMVGTQSVGEYEVALSYSFPHRFWNVTGDRTEKVAIEDADSVHLMATVRDPETGTVLPVGSVRADVDGGDKDVAGRRLWPMLSQNMGVHFGDNLALDGDDTYDVTVTVDPLGAVAAGDFAGTFEAGASGTFLFEFSRRERNRLSLDRLQDRAGSPDAVAPMGTANSARLPAAGDLPGDHVGRGTTGDAVFVATRLDAPPAGVEGDGPYLIVSPRTPYNRYPLPFMAVSATVERGGATVHDGDLAAAVLPGAGYHYGAVLDALQQGDELTLSVGAPPQMARHEGYETAFLEMGEVSMAVR